MRLGTPTPSITRAISEYIGAISATTRGTTADTLVADADKRTAMIVPDIFLNIKFILKKALLQAI
ncbi:MAG TPA: hypothetical protein QGH18_01660 [Arenicellales bacterium]|jgi:hypothetical protein|nr:hypothetical protein [Arenicellales bacterium]HJP44691.1 hypothetical protein [Arenicellales bacterium]|tara:strand:+ start:346 stop:540 length:195 start_codon:yes stop_codon:yes gene_type:complete